MSPTPAQADPLTELEALRPAGMNPAEWRLRLELAAMPRSGRARRELETRIARLEQMAGETLCTASYLAHYYDRS